jgi:hypothetical protein
MHKLETSEKGDGFKKYLIVGKVIKCKKNTNLVEDVNASASSFGNINIGS